VHHRVRAAAADGYEQMVGENRLLIGGVDVELSLRRDGHAAALVTDSTRHDAGVGKDIGRLGGGQADHVCAPRQPRPNTL
jgi:hypothetical protein